MSCEYENDGLYITSPGKFEGEPRYVPDLWEGALISDGSGDDVLTYTIEPEDRAAYPELMNVERVVMWEDDVGFVHSRAYERVLSSSWAITCIEDHNLMWSNELGWIDTSTFDLFTTAERETLSLPIGGQWVSMAP